LVTLVLKVLGVLLVSKVRKVQLVTLVLKVLGVLLVSKVRKVQLVYWA
jgi:hypothetical protein